VGGIYRNGHETQSQYPTAACRLARLAFGNFNRSGVKMNPQTNRYPKLHNAMWPGLVGKGSPGAEPCIDLDKMLDLTAAAEVGGVRFDGVDIFLYEPHIAIDISDDDLKRIADRISAKGFVVGSVVAPIWPPTGGGSAMGSDEERIRFVNQVRKACRIGSKLREWGVRPYGVVRIDSACSVADWAKDPETNTKRIAETFREACNVAEDFGERLAAEGEICWGGMHSWRKVINLLEAVGKPETLGFQADMAHTLLFLLGYNAPEDALLPQDYDWQDKSVFDEAMRKLTDQLRPWTIDFHVAQNDATVKGSGTHDKTGHHCLPTDPNGKLDIPRHAGFWLRDANGNVTRAFKHVCWDGCMFPNEVMMQPKTWNDILSVMIAVRDAHGWTEEPAVAPAPKPTAAEISAPRPASRAPAKRAPAIKKAKTVARPKAATPVPPKKTAKPAKPASAKPAVRKPAAKTTKPAKKTKGAAKTSAKPVGKAGTKKQRAKGRR